MSTESIIRSLIYAKAIQNPVARERALAGRDGDRLMAGLYAEHGWTLEECAAVFGCSKGWCAQRLERAGVPRRSQGAPLGAGETVPRWQLLIAARLEALGLPIGIAKEMAGGANPGSATWRRRAPEARARRWKSRSGYGAKASYAPAARFPPLERVWQEARRLTAAAAWLDGADYKDLAAILGCAVPTARVLICRLRKKGWLPK